MLLKDSYDVIVVGAGPVGLFLATELQRFGVGVAVLERLEAPSEQIKAGSVGSPSAEIFDQRGLLDRFPQPDLSIFPKGMPVGHFSGLWLLRGAPELRTLPVFAQQAVVEAELETYARTLGVPVLRGCTVTGLDGERVTAEHEGAAVELTARFVVGCDGGRSTVRRLAGFAFEGTPATITGRQALVDIAGPNPLAKGWHRTGTGMVVFGPGPQRVLTVEFDGPPADRDAPLSREEIEGSLRRTSGTGVVVDRLVTGTRWTDNTRQATRYRLGNVLLAGDAAHVHPPFGGQGLNLGFQDAVNLGWKLAATIAGWAPEGLLDTYHEERAPVAAAALANTRAQVALMRPDPQTSALREVFTDLLAYDEPNAHLTRLMSGVDRPYPMDSDHPEAGRIAADRPVGDARLWELLRRPGGLLLDATPDGDAAKVAAPWAGRVAVAEGPQNLLIRPDGVVAWGSAGTDGLERALTTWFGPH
ncbi:FAD-dependent monooxygenase [Dactylosporangium vinaceum]|uniref:FAD-dependent monooxygenase n=1 Tax=Dactylosporangium vinaceum TaxID=53362 RepID=A0ABV5MEM3_9ACTN|nr:FAD-dependent monooxygenase [Dactylosporangium vinaceum]